MEFLQKIEIHFRKIMIIGFFVSSFLIHFLSLSVSQIVTEAVNRRQEALGGPSNQDGTCAAETCR